MKKDKLPRKIRLSVDSTVLQRAATIGKDSLLTNTFVDTSVTKTKYVTKRPGFLLGIGGVTNGTNYGIYINPNTGNFYYIGGTGQPIIGSPPNYWNNYTSYTMGQKVIYRDDTTSSRGNKIYTAVSNNFNSIPSSINTDWGGNAAWTLVNTITTTQKINSLFYDGSVLRFVDILGDMYKNLDFSSSNINTLVSIGNVVGNAISAIFDNINSRFLYFWNAGIGSYFYHFLNSPYTNWSTQQNPISGIGDFFDSSITTIYNNFIYTFQGNFVSIGLLRLNTNTMLWDSAYTPTGLPTTGIVKNFFVDSSNLYFITDSNDIYKTSDGINWSLFANIDTAVAYFQGSYTATLFNGKVYLVNNQGGPSGIEVLSFNDGGLASSLITENTNSSSSLVSFLYVKASVLYKLDLDILQKTITIYKRP